MKSFMFSVQVNGQEWCNPNGQRFKTYEDAEASARDLESRWVLVTGWKVLQSEDEPNQDGPTIKGAGHRVKL